MGSKKTSTGSATSIPTSNSDAAEAKALVTAAPPAPMPLVTMAISDPSALEAVRRRTAQITAKRGRTALRIPLSSTAGVSGGVAIPT